MASTFNCKHFLGTQRRYFGDWGCLWLGHAGLAGSLMYNGHLFYNASPPILGAIMSSVHYVPMYEIHLNSLTKTRSLPIVIAPATNI